MTLGVLLALKYEDKRSLKAKMYFFYLNTPQAMNIEALGFLKLRTYRNEVLKLRVKSCFFSSCHENVAQQKKPNN